MINKKIEDITAEDLQALIDNNVPEGRTIEYKRDIPSNSDSSKKEFLADVTSFANTSGGDLIFGIEENNETHEPANLIGIETNNIDNERTRLDNIIRTGVEPRLPGVIIQPIPLDNSRYAIVIRIYQSWLGPHRVILGGHNKFYARNSSGKYEMNVDELRIAFNLSGRLIERIRNFRMDRISKILADEVPIPLFPHPKIVLHIIPINAFHPTQNYNIDSIYTNRHDILPLLGNRVMNGRFNLDGIMTYPQSDENGKYSDYTQLYRNGIVEAVNSNMLAPRDNTSKIIHSRTFEKRLIERMRSYSRLMSELQIEPPIFVFLSLLNVKDYKIETGDNYDLYSQYSIERDLLLLPEAIIEERDVSPETILKPIFDLIWNACGEPRSLNFDENGNWIEGR